MDRLLYTAMSGAKSMLHQTISHPVANIFVLIFVLFVI